MTEEPNDECVCSHHRINHDGPCTYDNVPAMGQCDCVGFRKREVAAVVVSPPRSAEQEKPKRKTKK